MTNLEKVAANSRQVRGGERVRIPVGESRRSKMSAPHRQGFHRRWVNGSVGRIAEMQAAGWEFVIDPNKLLNIGDGPGDRNNALGSAVSQITGVDAQGAPMSSYLMEIKEEWYREDQKRKDDRLKEVDNAIRRGNLDPESRVGGYVPEGGIDIN